MGDRAAELQWETGQTVFNMERLQKALASTRRLDPLLLTVVGALWVWKAAETAGKSTGLLRRNLGWGYVVGLTIPVVFTCALALFFLVRRIAATRR
jgi:hypothetical protein